jgi:hypothetical protein
MTSFTIPAPFTCLRDSAAIWESFPSRQMIYVSSSELAGKYFSGSRINSLRGTSTVECHYIEAKRVAIEISLIEPESWHIPYSVGERTSII